MQQTQETLCSDRDFNNSAINTASTPKKTGTQRHEPGKFQKICYHTGKFPYTTTAKAWSVIQRVDGNAKNGTAYRCPYCHHWHIGTFIRKPDARRIHADRNASREVRG